MPDLKTFPVFSDQGRIGTLTAPARFLDNRSEKTVQLDQGGEMVVAASALQVQPDGSFLLRGPAPASKLLPIEPATNLGVSQVKKLEDRVPADKMFREGYSIERVKIDRLITEPASQRQEGDTLILPVVEQVFVVEKRMMLREEIRITPSRDEITEITTIESPLQG